MENNKTPSIRFKGFTDPWEQRKFSDIVARESSISTSTTDIPSVEYEDVVAEEGRLNKDVHLKETVKSGITFDGSQVLYGKLRPYLHNWLNPDFKGIAVGDWWVLKPINIDKKFLYRLIQTQQFDNIANQSSGSKKPRADWNLISNSEFTVPFSKEEQSKIGRYFDSLDNLITLHQRKYNKLLNVKKSMLEKMFPKNESNIPEIRFKGFTDPWEQRKFSEGVSEIGDGLHGTPIYCEDGNVYFINGNNLVDGKIVISAETKKVNESQQSTADKSLDDTTILMSINGTIGNLAYYSGERLMLGKSAAYIKVSEFDKRFVYAYLQAPSVQGYFMDSLTGTTIKNLGLKAIREMIMFIPQDVDEQKRIGKFFDYLDNLITLHQRELEKLQNIKKSMLEKMFV